MRLLYLVYKAGLKSFWCKRWKINDRRETLSGNTFFFVCLCWFFIRMPGNNVMPMSSSVHPTLCVCFLLLFIFRSHLHISLCCLHTTLVTINALPHSSNANCPCFGYVFTSAKESQTMITREKKTRDRWHQTRWNMNSNHSSPYAVVMFGWILFALISQQSILSLSLTQNTHTRP